MKKYLIVSLAAMFAISLAQAQYKIAKSTGKLVLNLSSVRVEGYSGNEIIFTSGKQESNEDERAKGLRPINGSGLTDNTGVGLSVTDKGNTVEVSQVFSRDGDFVIKVPKNMSVSFSFDKVMNAGKVEFKDLDGEIEVSTQHNRISLENVTGPLTVKSVYGGVEAKLRENIKGPISLVSIYGFVDVAIPATTKANLSMKTSFGELLAASGLNIELEKTAGNDMVRYSNDNVKGKINGGGAELTLRSDYGKIYLRKAE